MSSSGIYSYVVLNIQGLCPQTKPSKVPYMKDLLVDNQCVFAALTETWLNKDHLKAEVDIEGYSLFRSDRDRSKPKKGRVSGGVCLYIKDDIAASFERVIQFSNGVVELLAVFSKLLNMCITVVYRQPDQFYGHRSLSTHFKAALEKLNGFLSNKDGCNPEIILCGDFNLPDANWKTSLDDCKAPKDEKEMILGLKEFNINFSLNQHIFKPTHKDGNVLDLLFTSNEELCHSYVCNDMLREMTHHKMIVVNTSYNFGEEAQTIAAPARKGLFKYNFFDDTINWENVKEEFQSYDWKEELDKLDADSMVERLIEICETVCSNHIPLKKSVVSSNCKNKIPRSRKVLMRRRRKLNLQLNKIGNSRAKKKNLTKLLVGVEKSIMESHAKSRSYQENKAVQAIKKNRKYFYSYVKKMSKVKSKIGPLVDKNGVYTSNPLQMANILAEQFSSVFSKMNASLPAPEDLFPDVHPTTDSSINDIAFTVEDVVEAILKLSISSASGPDGFACVLLENCVDSLSNPLYTIYRRCLDDGRVPKSFKMSCITPIFKSGSKGLPVNYRPVGLTSQLSKIFEKIVREHMLDFFKKKNVLNDTQHGFRKGRSCVSQLIQHFEKIIDYLEQGYNVDVVYLDFCKAFDKLDFNVLLTKLKNYGVGGKLGRWLYSFLVGREQCVMVDGFTSVVCAVLSGVPQGSVLGPLLFLVLINDIDENVKNAFLSSFADDTRVGMAVKNCEDVTNLQSDLDEVYKWADDNNMVLNSSKFELIKYGRKCFTDVPYTYLDSNQQAIDPTDNVKDLGVIMSSTALFSSHVENTITKVNKMVSWALRSFQSRSKDFILTVWKSIILPHLDYCSQLWNPFKAGEINCLELIQKCFICRISCFSEISYWDVLKDLELYSLQRRRERYRIIYLWSILEGLVPNPKPSQIYAKYNSRLGRTCAVPVVKQGPYQKLICSSFAVHAARLFNCLPKEIRSTTNCSKDAFKNCLDKYLKTVADEPQIRGYTAFRRANSNSLIDMINS